MKSQCYCSYTKWQDNIVPDFVQIHGSQKCGSNQLLWPIHTLLDDRSPIAWQMGPTESQMYLQFFVRKGTTSSNQVHHSCWAETHLLDSFCHPGRVFTSPSWSLVAPNDFIIFYFMSEFLRIHERGEENVLKPIGLPTTSDSFPLWSKIVSLHRLPWSICVRFARRKSHHVHF